MANRGAFTPRNLSLAAVCLQSTALAVVLHLSQINLQPGDHQYKASSAVLITELGKLTLSLLLALRDTIKERALLRRPVHTLPSPELYASGDEVHATDLYRDDPYDVPTVPQAMPQHKQHQKVLSFGRSPSANDLRRRSSTAVPKFSITFDPPSPNGQKLRFPELSSFSWPRPSLSPILSEKEASPELLELKSDETVLWKRRNGTIASLMWTDIFGSDWWKMGIPAVLFAIQNNLIYVAARNLSVPVYQITFQLKTVITAIAAVIMLNRRLAVTQWVSLVILGLGVATMQIGAVYAKASDSQAHAKVAEAQTMSYVSGITAVLISCVCSAVAATYFELVIKRKGKLQRGPAAGVLREAKPASLWVRNIQLSLFSTVLGLVVVLAQANPTHWSSSTGLSLDMDDPMLHWYDPVLRTASGFFVGFTALTWVVIFLQTVGGLLIAVAIKYADNVAKGFALAVSIVFTFLLSVILFNFRPTAASMLGALAVVASTVIYEMDDSVMRMLVGARYDPYSGRKPAVRTYHYGLLVVLGVTAFVALAPVRHFSVTTAAWELVAAHVESVHSFGSHLPSVAIADMSAVNELMTSASHACGWAVEPHRQSTKSAYGPPHPVPNDYPYFVTNTNQYALDDILTTRFRDYANTVPLLGATAPDFIFLPILSQLYSNPWGCQDPNLIEAIQQTTSYIRQIVASVGPTTYPRIILPVATIRSNLERELFKPELMEELRDSVIVLSIEGAPKSYKEGMKYMIDVPYPTSFHLSELAPPAAAYASHGYDAVASKTSIDDYFAHQPRPYLLHYAAAASHPWGLPATDPFNGFALRAVLHKEFFAFVESNPTDAPTQIIFDDIKNAFDGNQNLTAIHEHMESSIFCPMPAGDSPTRRAIYEAVLLGCIPVIFRERSYGRLFPSSVDVNDVTRYMVYVDENELINGQGDSLIARLEAISPLEIRRLQRNLKAVAPKMQWALPSKEVWFPIEAHSQRAKPLDASKPRWNRTESIATRASKVQLPDAFTSVIHELEVIKRGDWVPGIARDTRRVMKHFGTWKGGAKL